MKISYDSYPWICQHANSLDSHVPTLLLKCFNRLKFSSKHDFSLLGPKADFISGGGEVKAFNISL